MIIPQEVLDSIAKQETNNIADTKEIEIFEENEEIKKIKKKLKELLFQR